LNVVSAGCKIKRDKVNGKVRGVWHGQHAIEVVPDRSLPRKVVTWMSKELIMDALKNEELRKRLLEDLEVEELEEKVATRPWLCFMPHI
jgi:hypothetical protein